MMPRPIGLTERAMEATAGVASLRSVTSPLFEAAMASGRWDAMSEAKAAADHLNAARRCFRRIAALGEAMACPDGIFDAGHGRAA